MLVKRSSDTPLSQGRCFQPPTTVPENGQPAGDNGVVVSAGQSPVLIPGSACLNCTERGKSAHKIHCGK
ncbi:hypothetical protein BaRGS_00029277 [Batillaria attramentaria]|uniref:Uncharacterized protein n=1 Tax=Batillaria attramentaria TaxID=370345 RepID=A0ABD0JXV9_9CAEN